MPQKIIKEYEKVDKSELNNFDLSALQKFLEKNDIQQALQITPNGIKAKSYIGSIKCQNMQIDILPKLISKTDDNTQILKNLMYILSFVYKMKIYSPNTAKLAHCKNPFLEILINQFATSLIDGLKKQIPRNYIVEEDNLSFVKGKIKFTENIRYNISNKAKFYCQYDEFSENNLLNQLFKFVARCLLNITHDNYNKKSLLFILNFYSEIDFVCFNIDKAKKIKLTRNQQIFDSVYKLCLMFLSNSSIDLSKKKIENISLLWDMNKLFEEFVYMFIFKNKSKLGIDQVFYQKGRKLLKRANEKRINTDVDIFVKKGSEILILDTKYKLFNDLDDVSNGDIYQVSTYCLLHNSNHAILIYPRSKNNLIQDPPDETDFALNTYDTAKQDVQIDFRTIDLLKDDLRSSQEDLFKQIKEILGTSQQIPLSFSK